MAKKIAEIELDLNKDELQGWEKYKSPERVINYVYRNFNGERAPPVEVVKKGNVYQLCFGWPSLSDEDESDRCDRYGGHHRSIAHDISGHILKCHLMDEHEIPEMAEARNFFRVQDIRLYGEISKEYFDELSIFTNRFLIFNKRAIEKFVGYHKVLFDSDREKLYEFLIRSIEGCVAKAAQ